jgi:HSP20 family molecular chaperone IbpA
MATPKSEETSIVRISDMFSETFNIFQDQIRERAFNLSLNRKRGKENSLTDWLDAQSELSNPIHLKVKEQKKNIVIEGELKGFSPSEIEVEIKGDRLQVFGSHIETKSSKKSGSCESTSNRVTFYQSLPISIEVDLNKSQAKLFKNGTLKITLSKNTQTKLTS